MELVTLYMFGVIASVLLNSLVVVALTKKSEKLNYLDLLTFSLSTCDILKAVLGFSFEIYSLLVHNQRMGSQQCQLVGFTITFLGLVSISQLVGITVQRCITLRFPMKARIWSQNLTTAWYVIIPSWLYGLLWSLPPFLGWSSYREMGIDSHLCGPDLGNHDQEKNSLSYLINLTVWCFFVPILIIAFCSILIYQSLKSMRLNGDMLGLTTDVILMRRKLEKKQCIMGVVLIVSFLVAWSPFAVCVLMSALEIQVSTTLLHASATLGKSSSLFNPIIYCIFMEDIRIWCKEIIQGKGRRLLAETTSLAYRQLTSIIIERYQSRKMISTNLETCQENESNSLPIMNSAPTFHHARDMDSPYVSCAHGKLHVDKSYSSDSRLYKSCTKVRSIKSSCRTRSHSLPV